MACARLAYNSHDRPDTSAAHSSTVSNESTPSALKNSPTFEAPQKMGIVPTVKQSNRISVKRLSCRHVSTTIEKA